MISNSSFLVERVGYLVAKHILSLPVNELSVSENDEGDSVFMHDAFRGSRCYAGADGLASSSDVVKMFATFRRSSYCRHCQ